MLPDTAPLVGRSKFNKLVVYDKLKLMGFCQPEAFFNFVGALMIPHMSASENECFSISGHSNKVVGLLCPASGYID